MTPEEQRRLLEAFVRGDEYVGQLADAMYVHKVRVYHDTVAGLARQYNYAPIVELGENLLQALDDEAQTRAHGIADTFNHELANFAQTVSGATYQSAVERVASWASDRDEQRAEMFGIDAAYSAHADATAAFFLHNDLGDVTFDFGGHPPDAPPACPICQAIEAGNPHSLDRMLSLGTPHPQCRQSWHPQIDESSLPEELSLALDDVAGIVGSDSLVHRAGGQQGALTEAQSA